MHSTLVDGLQHAILEFSYAASAAESNGSGSSRAADKRRWGVVQPVGHLTVNEDGEGSNPSAPANSLLVRDPFSRFAREVSFSLSAWEGPLPANLSTRRPLIPHWYSPFFAGSRR